MSGFELTLAWLGSPGRNDLQGIIKLCVSSSTVSGGGLIPLSSNSDATEAVRIDPDSSEELSMTRATIKMRSKIWSHQRSVNFDFA